MTTLATRPAVVRASPVFLAVVAATVAGLVLGATDSIDSGVATFVFVTAGWVLSLIFHEFAHAFVAWKGGDQSIPGRGYLDLDPRRYADPITSLLLPLLLVLVGGIGLPGGAVWINRAALRSRGVASLVSLAGPATNVAFAAVCLLPLATGIVEDSSTMGVSLAFLGFLQVTAVVINLLPIPGLDGFGAIEPHLPRSVLAALAPVSRYGMIVLFLALWYIDPVNDAFWSLVRSVFDGFGIDGSLPGVGYRRFRFWEG